jgi:DNA-binding FadR family transcriptional regulator
LVGQGLHQRVLAELGPAIAGGEHPPGTVLRLDELTERFGVSRTVVREVVRVLESMQLVESRRRVGVLVRPRDDWNPYDPLVIRWRLAGADRIDQLRSLNELRCAIEPVAAGLAAERATPGQCGELVGLAIELTRTARAADLRSFLGHDVAFHTVVLTASGNEMFARLADVVREVLTGRTEQRLMPARPADYAVRLHTRVAEAISCHDAPSAERAMREIVTGALAEMAPLFAAESAAAGADAVPGPRGVAGN